MDIHDQNAQHTVTSSSSHQQHIHTNSPETTDTTRGRRARHRRIDPHRDSDGDVEHRVDDGDSKDMDGSVDGGVDLHVDDGDSKDVSGIVARPMNGSGSGNGNGGVVGDQGWAGCREGDTSQRNARVVAEAVRCVARRARAGAICGKCWMKPTHCLCGGVVCLRGFNTNAIRIRLLFHFSEVGSLSNTGKLLLLSGAARGHVAGLDESRLLEEELEILGLESAAVLESEIDKATSSGISTAVLFPSPDAINAVDFLHHGTMAEMQQDYGANNTIDTMSKLLLDLQQRIRCEDSTDFLRCSVAIQDKKLRRRYQDAAMNATSLNRKLVQLVTRLVLLRQRLTQAWQRGNKSQPILAIVLDGTYRQARLLNRKHVPPQLTRIKVNPKERSKFAPLRDGGDHRADIGRTSTIEAVAHMIAALDPDFKARGHVNHWVAELKYMVDSVKRQRGLSTVYGTTARQLTS